MFVIGLTALPMYMERNVVLFPTYDGLIVLPVYTPLCSATTMFVTNNEQLQY